MASSRKDTGLKGGPYKYCKIKDIEDATIINMYGVVKSFKSPSITQRGLHMTTIWIVDETCEENGCLTCLFISKDEREIPDPVHVGDVIRFHRVRTLQYQGYPQAKISPGFSWLIIHGEDHRHSHDDYTFTEKDQDRIEELQEWIKSSSLNLHIQQTLSYTKISHLKSEDKWFNLALQVISVHPSTSDNSCAMIIGWDSTEPEFESFCYCMMGEAKDEMDEKLLRLSAGRAIKIHCFDDHIAEALRLSPGQFIQIVNAHAKVISDHTVEGAAVCGYIDHELLSEERTWLGIVMHKGTTYGRRINVMSEQDVKDSGIKKEIDLFIKERERQNRERAQDATAGPSGVNDGNNVTAEIKIRTQSTPKKGTNDTKRNEEARLQNGIAGPSGVNDGNNVNAEIKVRTQSTPQKGTNDTKRNEAENGTWNRAEMDDRKSTREGNRVVVKSTPEKKTNDALTNAEGGKNYAVKVLLKREIVETATRRVDRNKDLSDRNAGPNDVVDKRNSKINDIPIDTNVSVAGKDTRQARTVNNERNEDVKNTSQGNITNKSNLRVNDILREDRAASTSGNNEMNRDEKRMQQQQLQRVQQPQPQQKQQERGQLKQQQAQQQQPQHDEGRHKRRKQREQEAQQQQPQYEEGQQQQQKQLQQQAQRQQQQQQQHETDMVWDNLEIASIREIASCEEFPSKFLCRVDTWKVKLRTLDEMIILCCENCNESLRWSCLPDEAMIEDETILCGECGGEVTSHFQFSIRIQDEMSFLDVQVCNKAAEEMFGGIKANEIRQSDENKVNTLRHFLKDFNSTGKQNLKRDSKGKEKKINRSALECCIRCYREETAPQNTYIAEHLRLMDL